ncbi:hypothetical protein QTP70_001481 [Hemibagrus guttatus]|uniref:ribonuclease H n=1 Tax=Hemibagrus guttatus TaxID=175788 RepID=A0AAE0QDE3_9TELE|nr:hypothetical protein QTP70_001481 [Hemibagrus guttatus]
MSRTINTVASQGNLMQQMKDFGKCLAVPSAKKPVGPRDSPKAQRDTNKETCITPPWHRKHNSNIIKYADDTTIVGRNSNNDELAYREEIQNLSAWSSMNNLTVHAMKTKELIVDFWKSNSSRHSPIYINGSKVDTNFIPDRSRPGLTTTAIGAVDLQGAGGNWATVGRRSRGGRRVRRQREKRKGKGRELADVMERRKVDILCVQETRWKGSKARSIGAGFKLFYYGVDSKRNGVGVVLKEEFVRNVLEVGCELEEKERFWSELDEVMESIPTGERVVIGADFNGHVGEGNTGDEEVMGKFGVKERNLEGQMVVDFAKRMDMAVVNTYFQKREEHRVTYKSGGRRTQIEKKTKWWKLKKEECSEVIRETGRKVLGVSSGRRKEDKETWWWNEEVQDSIQRKRLAKKKWDMDRTEENRQEYKELQRRVKREVSKAKQKAYEELYTRLDTREGEKDLYRLARQRDRDGKDVQQVRVIKDRDGRVLTSEESVQRRWKEYFEELMNEENEREKRVEGVNSVEQKVDKIRKDEVRKALKRMKSGKAVGPDDIPVEVWKCLGEAAVEFLANLFNRVLENLEKAYDRVPREELWYCMRKSGVAEKYVRVVQDMYERSRTVVRCAVGQTEEFNVEVGLHQGSALSPFLFAMVMDQLSEEVRQESPWTMMFADDIVICSESREQVEENLERWRFALERRGMKKLRQALGGQVVLPDDWETTEEVIRVTGRKVLGVSSGRRKEDKETWWWNEEVQDSIQRKRLAKKWDMDRTEENRQEYKELQRRVKREVSKAKQKAYDKLYTRLDTREGQKDLYRLARQRDQDGKDVQYRDGQRELHCVFVDLEKAYDRVPREELWYCMRKSGVAEKYVRVVQDMYERSRTVVRCAIGQTEEFKVKVGLQQGSALSPFLFVMVMDHCLRSTNFIPDRSRPGLTTTAISAVDLHGAGGNWATVGRRSRGGRRVHRQREKRKGKGRELADMMERRKVDILCVQEKRWKGSKARSIGAGFKLFYYGVDSKRNGVGVVLKEEFVRNVLEVGCELEEKERFWSELDEVMESIPTGERVVIGADFNGHVGEGNTGDEEVMGKFGVKERNLEGQMVVLPDDWETTAEEIRETGRKVLGVSSGRRKEDKETWWWNEEVQDSVQRKRLAKKKWDMDRTEENRQEYKELQRRVKRGGV